jgi:4-alpha-glucanotransferase
VSDFYNTWQILGQAVGIEPHYTDNWGRIHYTDPRIALRILETKGIAISADRTQLNPQVLVVSADDMPDTMQIVFHTRLNPTRLEKAAGSLTLTERDGRTPEAHHAFPADGVRAGIDEKTGLLAVCLPFPRDLPVGMYRVEVQGLIDDQRLSATCLWIVCPAKAYFPAAMEAGRRVAGVGLALYGVRSETNWGVGDFSDLKRLIDWVRDDLNGDFIGLNPLHALFNKRPFNSSPYLPSSRLYANFIYLDVMRLVEQEVSHQAREFLASPQVRESIARLRAEEHVNYEEVAALKLRVLRDVFTAFVENHSRPDRTTDRGQRFQAYRDAEGVYLERYATFCALQEHFQSVLPEAATWREWPEPFRNAESSDVRKFRQDHEREVLFWMYVQWQLDEQLTDAQEYALQRGMMVGLYHDQALAVDRNGADCWAWPAFFHDGFTVGAPPDSFAPDGQDWGFPPPDRDSHRSSGYELFLKQLEASCKHGGALRIDHVMQIHHLFWIPPGGKPSDGVYVKDYEQDLLNLLVYASRQNRTIIVGEDLGTLPPNFRETLMDRWVCSYRLFYFERDLAGNLYNHWEYPRSALVSVTTHDLPTLAGFWPADDIDTRRNIGQLEPDEEQAFRQDRTNHKAKVVEKLVQAGFLPADVAHAAWIEPFPTDELHAAVLKFLLHTPSLLVMINQEDILLDRRQQNFPGTTWQNPNWVTKMSYTVEELRVHPEARRLSQKFRVLLRDSGRSG